MQKPRFYQRPSWRIGLLLFAMCIVLASIAFTVSITGRLRESERERVELWAEAQRRLVEASDEEMEFCDFTLHSQIQERNKTIPVLLVDSDMRILDALNYPKTLEEDREFFKRELEALKAETEPIILETRLYKNYLYHRPSALIEALEWFPYVQLAVVFGFGMMIYLTLVSARQAEQERVWVGMAKETAHQLGTPISSLIGWEQSIRELYGHDEYLAMVADEIGKDVRLLQVVSERFSKIGAIPELTPTNVVENLERYHQYIRQRAARKITLDFPSTDSTDPHIAPVNGLLFDWVIENLLKNALDAMEGEGDISVKITGDTDFVYIDIQDSGKGMPKNLHKKIFEPGFTTKKRGWGLGLSLCKRIVEQYHKGKIFVKHSAPGIGTLFRVQLPRAK